MNPDTKGKVVVISGPSGAGKTSVCRALKEDPRVVFSVSATTRAMRDGEQEGIDYHFLSEGDFVAREQRGEFLESAVYNGNRYGTLRSEMDTAIGAGRIFIVEIEVQGTRSLREAEVEGEYVFVVPPSMEELRKRLIARGANSAEEIDARMVIAGQEMQARDLYDHVVVNEVLDDAIAEVRQHIGL